jgi:hypothetical protein
LFLIGPRITQIVDPLVYWSLATIYITYDDRIFEQSKKEIWNKLYYFKSWISIMLTQNVKHVAKFDREGTTYTISSLFLIFLGVMVYKKPLKMCVLGHCSYYRH